MNRDFACLELQKHESRGAGVPPLSRDMVAAVGYKNDANDTSDMRYHNAVDRTFTPMEELTKQMSRFVIRNLDRSVPPP